MRVSNSHIPPTSIIISLLDIAILVGARGKGTSYSDKRLCVLIVTEQYPSGKTHQIFYLKLVSFMA